VRLEWDPLLAGEVGGYVVERAPAADGPFTRVAVLSGRFQTLHRDSPDTGPGLADGQTVFYRVRAFSPAGQLASTVSAVAEATTAPVPGPPEDLRAYSLQPRKVPLSWSASEEPAVAGYVVERGPSSRGPFEEVARLDGRHSTVYVDEDLGDLRVLHYRVRTRNEGDVLGEPTPAVRAVTKPEPLPPFQLRAADQGLGVNRLSWEPNVEEDLAGYRLLRRREGVDEPELVATLGPDEARALDPGVGAGEWVAYTAVAFDVDGLESAATVPVLIQSAGYGLTATAHADRVELHWNPHRDEGWERARVLRSRRGSTREMGAVSGDGFVDSEVVPGGRYRYTLVLETADGRQAPPSAPLTVVVPES
jgi:hypothetical protein